jgi:hypothetical protein
MTICKNSNLRLIILSNLIIFSFSWNRATWPSSDGEGDIIYMDRHQPYCADGEVMQGWQLVNTGGGNYKIQYQCLKSQSVLSYDSYWDYTNYAGAANDIFTQKESGQRLSYHSPRCRDNYALQGWNVERNPSCWGVCDIRIKYKCVLLKLAGNCSSSQTGTTYLDKGWTTKIADQWIYLNEYNVLKGFHMNTWSWWSWFVTYYNCNFNYDFCPMRNMEAESVSYDTAMKNNVDYIPSWA